MDPMRFAGRLAIPFVFLCVAAFGRDPASRTEIHIPMWVANLNDSAPKPLSAKNLLIHNNGKAISTSFVLSPQSDLFLLIGLDLTGDVAIVAARVMRLIDAQTRAATRVEVLQIIEG